MGDSNIVTIVKFCSFPTFAEAKEAQHYDHLHMKAVSFATVTGIDLEIIRENKLHIPNEGGYEALDQYISSNNIEVVDRSLSGNEIEVENG